MGVTDVQSITVDGVKNFKARIDSEEEARKSWKGKWGWMLDEYKKVNDQLKDLKQERRYSDKVEVKFDPRSALPLPDTTNHEYGWLVNKPEFVLERYKSPGLARIPKDFPQDVLWKILEKYTRDDV